METFPRQIPCIFSCSESAPEHPRKSSDMSIAEFKFQKEKGQEDDRKSSLEEQSDWEEFCRSKE
ncbi:hypothetical protein SAY87_031041 [Trapa incisa]|uniref:Uncharacterized protein n=1 Tax=Trapa incisa TaxID=236973 RepID=A0AAN7QKP7_9MYRT|nr:hypothetical protein SAY87_031041 [Trapa incisa]